MIWEIAKKEHTIDKFRLQYYMNELGEKYRPEVKFSWNLAVLLRRLDNDNSEIIETIKIYLGL